MFTKGGEGGEEIRSELRSCVKVEAAVLGFPVPNKVCVCGHCLVTLSSQLMKH